VKWIASDFTAASAAAPPIAVRAAFKRAVAAGDEVAAWRPAAFARPRVAATRNAAVIPRSLLIG
jgi:hypothetical protein